ncbi:MAG TPA: hypothetical protein VGL22_21430 [Terracidiphilus sp.]
MNRRQNRSAWIWVAFAAIALASVARAESGLESARSYAHPMLEFFAGNHAAQPADLYGTAQHSLSRQQRGTSRNQLAGAWVAMLPVFFVGLVSPLDQLAPRSIRLAGAPPATILPPSFQRPPPQFA